MGVDRFDLYDLFWEDDEKEYSGSSSGIVVEVTIDGVLKKEGGILNI